LKLGRKRILFVHDAGVKHDASQIPVDTHANERHIQEPGRNMICAECAFALDNFPTKTSIFMSNHGQRSGCIDEVRCPEVGISRLVSYRE